MTERELGKDVPGWKPPPRPDTAPMQGRLVRLEPLNADAHAFELHEAFQGHDWLWDYMPYGPFASGSAYHRWARQREEGVDLRFFVLRDQATGHPGGIASYLRIDPDAGSIEVGNICYAPGLQRGVAATEAMFLMMDWAFRAGYRRYEWKCNALNLPSRRVFGDRQRMARLGRSVPGLAGSVQFRRQGAAEGAAVRPDRAGPGEW
jgi:RimJ/RimL family protein N-acetyltransferase